MSHLVTELAEQISCIDTLYQRPGLAACYLLESQGEAAFIDTGTAHAVPTLLHLLSEKRIDVNQVKYVIPTHVHLDHAGGAGKLMQQLPAAQLVIHPFGTRHMTDPAKLIAGATAVYGETKFRKLFGTVEAVSETRVIEAPDGLTLSLGSRQLTCLDTPGHARHHICIYDDQSQGFFTGDSFGLSYREFDNEQGPFILPTTTPVQFDPDAWHNTLDRLMEYHPESIFLTHFGQVKQPAQLASDLHRGIDAFAQIALGAEPDKRSQQIRTGLLEWSMNQLRARQSRFSQQQIETLLGMDLDLNTQGLEVWLDRQA